MVDYFSSGHCITSKTLSLFRRRVPFIRDHYRYFPQIQTCTLRLYHSVSSSETSPLKFSLSPYWCTLLVGDSVEDIPRLAEPLGCEQVPSQDQHCLAEAWKTQQASFILQSHPKSNSSRGSWHCSCHPGKAEKYVTDWLRILRFSTIAQDPGSLLSKAEAQGGSPGLTWASAHVHCPLIGPRNACAALQGTEMGLCQPEPLHNFLSSRKPMKCLYRPVTPLLVRSTMHNSCLHLL